MNHATPRELIAVDALRVGMFVHLDLGWMSHPFPRSSFKIASPEQIGTIRSLGLEKVRWNPCQSDAELPIEPAAPAQTPGSCVDPAEPADAAQAGGGDSAPSTFARRRALSQQTAALARCERQFAEAARDCRRATETVLHDPAAAATQAVALSNTLLGKMGGEQNLCIRLLTDAAGDKAAAHSLNVAIVSMLMGRAIGLPEHEMVDLCVGALMHDIGKLDLPERVRHRDEHFSPGETRYYEEHVAHGVAHARKMGLSPGATLVIAQHHEHADASGFPLRVGVERMSTPARIVALVNRYDKLCNPHVPSRAMTPHEALSLLFAQSKSQFDSGILGAFIKMMGVYPPGSVVQLTDDRFAMVVAVNSERPLKPRVLVHDAAVPRDDALVLDLETSPALGIRRSVKPLQLPEASLAYLSPRPRVAYFFEPAREAEAA